jgi:hypothetical protein
VGKIKEILKEHQDKIILTIGGILIATASFGAGRLTTLQKSEPIVVENSQEENNSSSSSGIDGDKNTNDDQNEVYGKYVGSLEGNVYYLASSAKAKDIDDDEKIWFESKEEAEEQGYKSGEENKNTKTSKTTEEESDTESFEGKYVASKNGSKYYLPECSGVKRIKEENKIWFDTIKEAEKEGYEPAKNCKELYEE